MKLVKITTDLLLDEKRHLIINIQSGESQKIEPRLAQILQMLVQAKGQLVPRQEIIKKIWGTYGTGQQLLNHSISMLRKHLGQNIIVTVSKKGYFLEIDQTHVMAPRSVAVNWKHLAWLGLLLLMILKWWLLPHH